MNSSGPEYIAEAADRFGIGYAAILIGVLLGSGIIGAGVADRLYDNYSPNEVIELIADHHILKLRSIKHSESRILEEAWFDHNNDGYSDEIVLRASPSQSVDTETVWRLSDSDGDGWIENAKLSFRGQYHAGSFTVEGAGPGDKDLPSVKLSLQPLDPKLPPVVYQDKSLDGMLARYPE